MKQKFAKDIQYYKFCLYGFLKNLKLFEPFLILFLASKDITYTQIGLLYSIKMIVRVIFEIPSGVIADALGRKGSMLFSYSCYILSFLLYYLSYNYILLITATIIFAIGDAFRTGTHKAMIFEYLRLNDWQDQKIHYYGHTRSWSQFGSAISSLIAATIVFYSGNYDLIFLFTMIPYIIGFILLASYPCNLNGVTTKLNLKSILQSFYSVSKELIMTLMKFRNIKCILSLTSYSGFYFASKDFLQPILKTFVLSIPFLYAYSNIKQEAIIIGFVYFIIYFITSIASKSSGKITEQFKSYYTILNLLLIAGFIAGLLTGIFLKFELYLISVILFVLIYIIENLRRPMAISCVSEIFNNKILASALSVESQIRDLLGAVFVFFIGLIADVYSLSYSFIIICLCLLIVSPFIMLKRN